ncbi:cobalamin biosynthesis protein [Methylobacterium sp. E-005]|uniref:cobalamin biosynthesis protein n=1 Tax=Methylobacterium sp. E-005 TaxID=2836549 RepID=UPI001FBBA6AF|nr:cobalamin biosynthesis protein [Methylobacterium sp. E-005]MCJ2090497.1 cobalamin biosynthesis protein [Methylobacterium sp. E-005]
MTNLLAAGIGFRRGTGADEIAALITRALLHVGAGPRDLTAIATAADRTCEPAIAQAAARFSLSPCPIDPEALAARDAELVTRSARIEHLRGVGSLAEAAALAAAGPGSRLTLPRIASAGATCALAVGQSTIPAA